MGDLVQSKEGLKQCNLVNFFFSIFDPGKYNSFVVQAICASIESDDLVTWLTLQRDLFGVYWNVFGRFNIFLADHVDDLMC